MKKLLVGGLIGGFSALCVAGIALTFVEANNVSVEHRAKIIAQQEAEKRKQEEKEKAITTCNRGFDTEWHDDKCMKVWINPYYAACKNHEDDGEYNWHFSWLTDCCKYSDLTGNQVACFNGREKLYLQ